MLLLFGRTTIVSVGCNVLKRSLLKQMCVDALESITQSFLMEAVKEMLGQIPAK